MATLKSSLLEDSEFVKFNRIKNTVQTALVVDDLLKEAALLHATRKSRALHSKKLSPLLLQDAILTDLSNRSRLVELRSLLSRQIELLGTSIETIRRHIHSRYKVKIQELASTQGDRARIVDKALSTSLTLKAELVGSSEIIDLYIKDIDSASYQLRNAVDLLKMILDRRGVEHI